ncbi:uncharacterized protein LOC111699066 isoform X2 [Eurytemora carolleeae]|uniref:uncharacterized protein LOC111699066 isoform X2 n=1 Tax=Eurytemora carolleeae TaxID=1294199 RepID=UPI000C793C04|nr:uncharacterized protein LOC111699066 isoform X2 [Eurytemora carolleeae]|eukprot:XP_023325391.1 uncharacterized protein LOC111699066 isoform X2 [Eurytemora affinis]
MVETDKMITCVTLLHGKDLDSLIGSDKTLVRVQELTQEESLDKLLLVKLIATKVYTYPNGKTLTRCEVKEIINPDEPDVLPETFTRLVLHGAYSDQFISHKVEIGWLMLIQYPKIEEYSPLPHEVLSEARSPWTIRIVARRNKLLPVVKFILLHSPRLQPIPEPLVSQPSSSQTRPFLSETLIIENLFKSGNDFTPSFPGSVEPPAPSVEPGNNLVEKGTSGEPSVRELKSPVPSTSTQETNPPAASATSTADTASVAPHAAAIACVAPGVATALVGPVGPDPVFRRMRPLIYFRDEGRKYSTLKECRVKKTKYNVFAVVSEILELPQKRKDKLVMKMRIQDESLDHSGVRGSFKFDILTSYMNEIPVIQAGSILRIHNLVVEVFMGIPDGRVFNALSVTSVNGGVDDPVITESGKPEGELIWKPTDTTRVEQLRLWYSNRNKGKCVDRLLEDIKEQCIFNLYCRVSSIRDISEDTRVYRVEDGTISSLLSLEITDSQTQDFDFGVGEDKPFIDIFVKNPEQIKGLDVAAGQYVYLEKVQCGVDEVDQSQNLESLNQYFKFSLNSQGGSRVNILDSDSTQEAQLRNRLGDRRDDSSLVDSYLEDIINFANNGTPMPSPKKRTGNFQDGCLRPNSVFYTFDKTKRNLGNTNSKISPEVPIQRDISSPGRKDVGEEQNRFSEEVSTQSTPLRTSLSDTVWSIERPSVEDKGCQTPEPANHGPKRSLFTNPSTSNSISPSSISSPEKRKGTFKRSREEEDSSENISKPHKKIKLKHPSNKGSAEKQKNGAITKTKDDDDDEHPNNKGSAERQETAEDTMDNEEQSGNEVTAEEQDNDVNTKDKEDLEEIINERRSSRSSLSLTNFQNGQKLVESSTSGSINSSRYRVHVAVFNEGEEGFQEKQDLLEELKIKEDEKKREDKKMKEAKQMAEKKAEAEKKREAKKMKEAKKMAKKMAEKKAEAEKNLIRFSQKQRSLRSDDVRMKALRSSASFSDIPLGQARSGSNQSDSSYSYACVSSLSSSPKSQDKRVETEHEEIDDNQLEIDDQTEKKEDDQLNGDETISLLRVFSQSLGTTRSGTFSGNHYSKSPLGTTYSKSAVPMKRTERGRRVMDTRAKIVEASVKSASKTVIPSPRVSISHPPARNSSSESESSRSNINSDPRDATPEATRNALNRKSSQKIYSSQDCDRDSPETSKTGNADSSFFTKDGLNSSDKDMFEISPSSSVKPAEGQGLGKSFIETLKGWLTSSLKKRVVEERVNSSSSLPTLRTRKLSNLLDPELRKSSVPPEAEFKDSSNQSGPELRKSSKLVDTEVRKSSSPRELSQRKSLSSPDEKSDQDSESNLNFVQFRKTRSETSVVTEPKLRDVFEVSDNQNCPGTEDKVNLNKTESKGRADLIDSEMRRVLRLQVLVDNSDSFLTDDLDITDDLSSHSFNVLDGLHGPTDIIDHADCRDEPGDFTLHVLGSRQKYFSSVFSPMDNLHQIRRLVEFVPELVTEEDVRLNVSDLKKAEPGDYLLLCQILEYSFPKCTPLCGYCTRCRRLDPLNMFLKEKSGLVCGCSGRAGGVEKIFFFLLKVRDQTGHELEVEVRGQEAVALMGHHFSENRRDAERRESWFNFLRKCLATFKIRKKDHKTYSVIESIPNPAE